MGELGYRNARGQVRDYDLWAEILEPDEMPERAPLAPTTFRENQRRLAQRKAARHLLAKDYDESQHPRDAHGRWTSGGVSEREASQAIIARPSSAYPPAHPDAIDTAQRFTKDDGGYTQERLALHEAILAEQFVGHEPATGTAIVTFLGGGPASGKSSIVVDTPPGSVRVDVDAVRQQLPEYREGLAAKDIGTAAMTHEESSAIGKEIARTAAAGNYHTVMDGTGDNSLDSLSKKVAVFRASGHEVVGQYVTVDTDVAVTRAAARGAETGRYVPKSVIRETHASVSRVLPAAVRSGVFDRVSLWDTNGPHPRMIMSAVGRKMTVHNQGAWLRFLAKGKE